MNRISYDNNGETVTRGVEVGIKRRQGEGQSRGQGKGQPRGQPEKLRK